MTVAYIQQKNIKAGHNSFSLDVRMKDIHRKRFEVILCGLPHSRAMRDECGRGGKNRTSIKGFGDLYSTIELHP